MSLLTVLENEAHVWLAFADKHSDPRSLAEYREMLSAEERERYNSFFFARDRDLYQLTHGLLRTTLSKYLEIAPDKWVFKRGLHGRPEIDQLGGAPSLRFSVSRTDGLVACLVVLSIDAGVDVENIGKLDDAVALSEDVLTDLEISWLRDLPEGEQREGFFTLWTLKEAYVKARGAGLLLPLNHFAFYFDRGGDIRISLNAEVQDMPSDWQFATFRPTRSHAIAVALRREDRADLRIRFFEAVPECAGL